MVIVPVTAIPYAAASALEDLNMSTTRMHPSPSARFTSGTNICPVSDCEVWTICTRGL